MMKIKTSEGIINVNRNFSQDEADRFFGFAMRIYESELKKIEEATDEDLQFCHSVAIKSAGLFANCHEMAFANCPDEEEEDEEKEFDFDVTP